jgi:hypothetical protein
VLKLLDATAIAARPVPFHEIYSGPKADQPVVAIGVHLQRFIRAPLAKRALVADLDQIWIEPRLCPHIRIIGGNAARRRPVGIGNQHAAVLGDDRRGTHSRARRMHPVGWGAFIDLGQVRVAFYLIVLEQAQLITMSLGRWKR